MKTLFLFPFIILSLFFSKPTETDLSKYNSSYEKSEVDTLILEDTIKVTLNVFYNEKSPYQNFEGDTTKRNIYKVRYLDSNLELYHIIDYKTDFWEINDSNSMVITDTIEFYVYPHKK